MKLFEYKTEVKIISSPKDKTFKRWFCSKEEIDYLNEFGKEGWELSSTVHQKSDDDSFIAMYYFKREL